jgi:predicted DNA-binding mobile mystery protein A
MPSEYAALRVKQLDRALAPFKLAAQVSRPRLGWLKAIRQALGVSSTELARRLGTSRQRPLQIEMAEAEDRITLKSLRAAANALDCDLVYALVPRISLQELQEQRLRDQATERVLSIEHSMALEDQAVGDVEAAIAAEMRDAVKPRRR